MPIVQANQIKFDDEPGVQSGIVPASQIRFDDELPSGIIPADKIRFDDEEGPAFTAPEDPRSVMLDAGLPGVEDTEPSTFERAVRGGIAETGKGLGTLTKIAGREMQDPSGVLRSILQGKGAQWALEKGGADLERAGELVESKFQPSVEKYAPPERFAGKNPVDNPELLSDPEWWKDTVGRGAPSMAASILPAFASGKAIQYGGKLLSWTPQVINRLSRLGAAVTGGTVGGGLEGAGTYEQALEMGLSEPEARVAAEQMTLVSAGLNALSIDKALGSTGGSVVKKFWNQLSKGLTEGVTEWAEEPSQAVILGRDVWQGMKEGTAVLPSSILLGSLIPGGGRATDLKTQTQETISRIQARLGIGKPAQATGQPLAAGTETGLPGGAEGVQGQEGTVGEGDIYGKPTLQMRENAQTWGTELPGLPRSTYEELAKISPAELSGAEKEQLQTLRERISATGETATEAMRTLWGPELAEAPPRLRQALTSGLAMPSVPLATTQKTTGKGENVARATSAEHRFSTQLRQEYDDLIAKGEHDKAFDLAYKDNLTGVYNQNGWERLKNSADADPNVSIAASDMSGLKYINDKYGHEAGDQVIKAYAESVNNKGGMVFRSGKGDELNTIHENPEQLAQLMQSAKEELRQKEFSFSMPSGIIKVKGVDLDYGIANTNKEADATLYANRTKLEKGGQRNPIRGGKPFGLEETPDSKSTQRTPEVTPLSENVDVRTYVDQRSLTGNEYDIDKLTNLIDSDSILKKEFDIWQSSGGKRGGDAVSFRIDRLIEKSKYTTKERDMVGPFKSEWLFKTQTGPWKPVIKPETKEKRVVFGKKKVPAKEPWQMTREEFKRYLVSTEGHQAFPRDINEANAQREIHKQYIEQALSEGKPVSENVLKEYGLSATPPEVQGVRGAPETPEKPATLSAATELHAGIPIAPAVRAVIHKLNDSQIIDGLKRGFAAITREGSEQSGAILSEQVSRMERYRDQFLHGMKEADKLFKHSPNDVNLDFMQRMDTGKFQQIPEFQTIADAVKIMFNNKVRAIQELGTGALEQARENYFPHIWKQGKGNEVLQALSRRPFEGSKGFLKQRVFDDVMAGIEAGYKPVSYNPLDLVALKMAEMDKYIVAHRTITALKEKHVLLPGRQGPSPEPEIKFFKASEKPGSDYTKIDDKFSTVWRPVKDAQGNVTGRAIAGHYYAKDATAQVLNNYLSQNLYNNKYIGGLFSGYMSVANHLNQFQLGVGSMFHAGFTSMESVISQGALGIRQLSEGRFKDAARSFGKAPAAWILNPMLGNKLIKEWRKPGSQGADMAQIIEGLMASGGRLHALRGERFQMNDTKKMIENWHSGTATGKVKAILGSPLALVEQTARPILEWLVPRQKFGVFGELMNDWIKQHPEASHEEMRTAARQFWNRVDSRLGQVIYDRIFAHNVAKNIVQALVRAPGWTGGTILEVGGGAVDAVKFIGNISEGKKPVLTDRMAYTLSLLMVTAAANGLLTAAFTGEVPKDKDFWAFRTGRKEKDGRDERFMLPTYAKDIYAYYQAPLTLLGHKTHPVISAAIDMAKNKDYYGNQIRNEDENFVYQLGQEVGYAVKQFKPFWIAGLQKAEETGKSMAAGLAPLVGVMPAPKSMTQTDAEKLIDKINRGKKPEGGYTEEQQKKREIKQDIVQQLRSGDISTMTEINAIAKENDIVLSHTDKQNMILALKEDPASEKKRFENRVKSFSAEEIVKVYRKMNDDEKEKYTSVVKHKVLNSMSITRGQRQEYLLELR